MKKKLLLTTLLMLLVFTLYSCMSLLPKKEYNSENTYETSIIETVESIGNSNVAIFDGNSHTSEGSAVVIKKIKNEIDYTYYVLTAKSVASNASEPFIRVNSRKREEVIDLAYNEQYDLAILSFNSKEEFDVAKVLKDNNAYEVSIGETIISKGTDSLIQYPNTAKQGFVTNNNTEYLNNNYYFTHDASNNAGEIGSGVYNLDGYLVGLNVNKKYFNDNEEYLLGLNYALKISEIAKLFQELNNIDFENKIIDNSLLEPLGNNNIYEKDEYEQAISDVYNLIKDSVVRLKNNDKDYSGIIINKVGLTYQVLTTKLDDTKPTTVYINNNEYIATSLNSILSQKVSIVTFVSVDSLPVYEIGETSNITRGQTTVLIGSVNETLINSLNVGTLSATKGDLEYEFMHSTKANQGQLGSPIFNLNGELIGIYNGKISETYSSTGVLAVEAISFAINLEHVYLEMTSNEMLKIDYETELDYELKVMKVINEVFDVTVTIKSDYGHGSGIIFKREQIGNKFLYYVLTNEHVIGASDDGRVFVPDSLSISFNDERKSVRVKDYHEKAYYDMAVLRFESDELMEVYESPVLNRDEQNKLFNGQVVIAVGTPLDSNRYAYVTTGIITKNEYGYEGLSPHYALLHSTALNPGNSGGPLFDLNGNLLGINVAKGKGGPSVEGQTFGEGLSITLNINKLSDLIYLIAPNKYTLVSQRANPKIGIVVSPLNGEGGFLNTTPNAESYLHESATNGIVIRDVDDLFDAYGKLEIFDVIIDINGTVITTTEDVGPLLANKDFGYKLYVTVLRKGIVDPIVIEVLLS